MIGEDWFGPPCGCEEPKWIGFTDNLDFDKERARFLQDPYAYQYPWAHAPVPRDTPLKAQLLISERRYGRAFVLPIRIGLGILPDPED
jgi:hypothetical protein